MTANISELQPGRAVPSNKLQHDRQMGWLKGVGLGLAVLVCAGAVWEGSRQVRSLSARPDAILVLGGAEERERYAARMARELPDLEVWVSSGSPRWYAERIFDGAGVAPERVRLDYRAQDTVTNFTTLADELQARGVNAVYLVTSERHMLRARLIGEIVFGSRGILLVPASVPSERHLPAEPSKAARDGLRSLFWVATGRTEMPLGRPKPARSSKLPGTPSHGSL